MKALLISIGILLTFINSQAREIECNVIKNTATITIPVEHKEKVSWFKKSTLDSGIEFSCLGVINEYEFGFSLFKSSEIEQTGTIKELIKYGQINMWKIDEDGAEILEGYKIKVTYSPKQIKIHVSDKKTFDLLFKNKPKTFYIFITGFKLTCKSRSNIIKYQK